MRPPRILLAELKYQAPTKARLPSRRSGEPSAGMLCDRIGMTPYDAVEGRLLGGFANTRRANANAGDLHSGELQLQLLRRVRSMAEQWDLYTSDKSHMSSKTSMVYLQHVDSSAITGPVYRLGRLTSGSATRPANEGRRWTREATRTVIRQTSVLSLSLLSHYT
ncbi:hypothetical protein BDU57DRAFT_309183 [Ampelomyces quisqualis]|uniref:Uncharacterized protein n=1 Tax=Ampelomyces quisqualis TaxID=50730 RepID=A0A6A5QJD7_AMPQU|nr:hypothetical protein BDU57DRAFT_309183 [Ampelomyces quisqualis]